MIDTTDKSKPEEGVEESKTVMIDTGGKKVTADEEEKKEEGEAENSGDDESANSF